MGIDKINKVNDYLNKLNILHRPDNVDSLKVLSKKIIYRGQSQYQKDGYFQSMSCSAARRLWNSKKSRVTNVDLYDYTYKLLQDAKTKNYHYKNGKTINDFELLADLQHFGCATVLMDFTKNALVALYFACCNNPGEDGVVFMMNICDSSLFNELEIEEENQLENTLLFNTNNKLFFWEPSILNERIPAQNSIFILGAPEIDNAEHYDYLIIDGLHKHDILNELTEYFGMNSITLFNDLPGFAMANQSNNSFRDEYRYVTKAKNKYRKLEESFHKSEGDHSEEYFCLSYFAYLNSIFFKDYTDAIKLIENCLNANNQNKEHKFYKAMYLLRNKDINGAMAIYNELYDSYEDEYYLAEYAFTLGEILKKHELLPTIIRKILNKYDDSNINEIDKLSKNKRLLLSSLYGNLGLAIFKIYTEVHEHTIQDHKIENLSIEISEELYKTSIQLNRLNHIAYNNLGVYYRYQKQYKKAIESLTKSIELADAFNIETLFQRALACKEYIENNVFDPEIYNIMKADVSKGLSVSNDDNDLLILRAYCYKYNNQFKESLGCVKEAIKNGYDMSIDDSDQNLLSFLKEKTPE